MFGVAVPASYVDELALPLGDAAALPWMSEQDPMKGNFDVMVRSITSLLFFSMMIISFLKISTRWNFISLALWRKNCSYYSSEF